MAASTPTTSRRSLLGAGASSLLLVAATGTGAAKAAELDGELIAACRAFVAAVADEHRGVDVEDKALVAEA